MSLRLNVNVCWSARLCVQGAVFGAAGQGDARASGGWLGCVNASHCARVCTRGMSALKRPLAARGLRACKHSAGTVEAPSMKEAKRHDLLESVPSGQPPTWQFLTFDRLRSRSEVMMFNICIAEI